MREATQLLRDEHGFTSTGMAVALLVSLALIFSSVQVYRVNSAAAEVQEVADAAALAAENQVGEYMVAVRVVDATLLSLTLTGEVAYGLGVVCLCVPPVAEWGAQLIATADKVLDARDRFAKRATTALDELQKALPILAAAAGASVASANSEVSGVSYHALALLLPTEGKVVATGPSEAEAELEEAVEERGDALAEAAEAAERAAQEAIEAKQRAFQHDCGAAPAYCMYERAAHLARLGAAENPLYQSVDTWSFSVALVRARAYYRERILNERPEGSSLEEKVRSALRKRFYAHAARQLRRAYVVESEGAFAAFFPRFPRNTEQMRATDLYTEPVYPVTVEGGVRVMHAWDGCPEAGLVDSYGSVCTLEEGGFQPCPGCQFSATALGSVAAASTAIDNGFEYHYDIVAQAAEDYQRALSEGNPSRAAAKDEAESLLDAVMDALREAASCRIEAHPPGATGCIALVVATGGASGGAFESAFVDSGGALGPRVACAAATLIADETEDASVVGDLLSGLARESSLAGVGSLVLECWSALLGAYELGIETLIGAVESALDELPLIGASGLGPWAAGTMRDGLSEVGLQPADTAPLKAVLVDSVSVARRDASGYGQRFLEVRERALALPADAPDAFSALGEAASGAVTEYLGSQEIQLAVIEVPGTDIAVPLTVTLPPELCEGAGGLVREALSAIRSAVGVPPPLNRWE